ncbi:MAG: betaine-aldehyde dehydrogenase [Gammaproteobacteria bacterium]
MPKLDDITLYIHGQNRLGRGGGFDTLNPATGEVLCHVQSANAADIDIAVESAREGFAEWSAMSGARRGRVLHKVRDILRARNDELAHLETLDTGKPISESASTDIMLAAECFEYYGGAAAMIGGEYFSGESGFAYTRREPLGICAGIGAWNYPLQVAAWKIAPALACGNAMIYKPAELTPMTAAVLAQIITEAGAPPGVFNVVHGDGKVGAMLSRHQDIAKVSLTGEVCTGKEVMRDAAATLKRITLELGGKSPLLVFDDADINNAVSAAMIGNFFTQGEVCTNCTRVFLHRNIKDAFVKLLLHRTAKLITGDPLDIKTQIGALISEEHRQKVLSYIDKAKKAGATLLCGGGKPQDPALAKGAFVEPTIFDNCTDEMPNVIDEIFGPVMSLLVFDDEAEALERANNTRYGLAAGVFTADINRAHRVAAKLQAGVCWINDYNQYPPHVPAGGFKESGIGCENGTETIRHYTQLKTVHVNTSGAIESPYE